MLPKKHPFGDPLVLFVIGLLFCIGVFVLYTTVPLNAEKGSWLDSLVARQMIFGAISFLIMFAITRVDLQITKTLIIQGLGLGSVVLLLGGLFILGPIVNETHRWYKVGQFLFQPSEFAKIAYALGNYWVTNDKIKVV
jgi:cell division protein FtsW (lipid II flippase)